MAAEPAGPGEGSTEAAALAQREAGEVARGSGLALVGNVINRGVRLINTWYLSGALGVAGFGLYASVTTIATVLSYLAPLGMNSGVVLFGARARSNGDRARQKGTLLATFGGAALSGLFWMVLIVLASGWWAPRAEDPALPELMAIGSLGVAFWALVLVAVGALRVARDNVGQTLLVNVVQPLALVGGSLVGVGLGYGVTGAVVGFGVAQVLSFAYGLARLRRPYGALFADRALKPEVELGKLLRFSLPESLSSMLFRFTQWMDVLMLTAMSTSHEVGLYRVAVSISLIGNIPAAAVQTIFNATAAELLHLGKTEALDRVLKLVTRWISLLAAVTYLGLVVGQDVLYVIFDTDYAAGASSMVALMVGQLLFTAAVPTTALIPMAGMARLNLINGIAATLLNGGLNALLIPAMGSLGASVATAITLILWSGWRVWQVKKLIGCFPFTGSSVALLGGALLLGQGLRLLTAGAPLALQLAVSVAAPLALLVGAWRWGRTPEDDALLEPALRRLRRILKR